MITFTLYSRRRIGGGRGGRGGHCEAEYYFCLPTENRISGLRLSNPRPARLDRDRLFLYSVSLVLDRCINLSTLPLASTAHAITRHVPRSSSVLGALHCILCFVVGSYVGNRPLIAWNPFLIPDPLNIRFHQHFEPQHTVRLKFQNFIV